MRCEHLQLVESSFVFSSDQAERLKGASRLSMFLTLRSGRAPDTHVINALRVSIDVGLAVEEGDRVKPGENYIRNPLLRGSVEYRFKAVRHDSDGDTATFESDIADFIWIVARARIRREFADFEQTIPPLPLQRPQGMSETNS